MPLIGRWGMYKGVGMPISLKTGDRAETMLIQTLETGGGMVGVAIRSCVQIETHWGMRLPSEQNLHMRQSARIT